MKRNIWLVMCVAFALTLLAGCKGDEPVEAKPKSPVLTFESVEVEAMAEGGRFTLGYTLENPKDGAKLLVTPEHDWVKNISTEVVGELSFDVEPSYESAARTCRIDVSYPGVYPSKTITVRQSVGLEHSISFTLQEVNSTNIIMDIVPKDPTLSYVFILGNGKYIEENGLMEDDDALWASDMDIFQGFANAFGSDVASVMPTFMLEGEQYGHRINGVTPNTKYVAYAYGFDVKTMTPTTEICRLAITTKAVEDYVVDFNLSTDINGPYVKMEIEAVNYDGPFFFGLFAAADCPESMDDETFRSLCSTSWEQEKGLYSSFFDTPEQGLHFIFNELAYYDKATWEGELAADTEYVLWAFGMNSEAIINSTPVRHYFKTGSVAASENKFTVTVTDVKSRRATVNIETTTDDSYVALLVTADKYADTDDAVAMQHIIDNYNINLNTGSDSEVATGLTPSTEYEVLVFGCKASRPTTALTRVKFTTAEVVYADLDIEVRVDAYYDMAELIAVDNSWAAYEEYDALVKVSVDVDPDAVEYYFSADYAAGFEYYPYETIIEGLVAGGAATEAEGFFPMNYGEEYLFFGVAKDAEGDYTEVYQTKPTKFTYEGRSDIGTFL